MKCVAIVNSHCVETPAANAAPCMLYMQAWDDVERKARPADKMSAYSKKTVLDQEKSKLSLSQIYEQQFLKQTQVCIVGMLAVSDSLMICDFCSICCNWLLLQLVVFFPNQMTICCAWLIAVVCYNIAGA